MSRLIPNLDHVDNDLSLFLVEPFTTSTRASTTHSFFVQPSIETTTYWCAILSRNKNSK